VILLGALAVGGAVVVGRHVRGPMGKKAPGGGARAGDATSRDVAEFVMTRTQGDLESPGVSKNH